MRSVLLVIGPIVTLASSAVYIASILRGKSKPQRMTRLLLTLITGLAFVALLLAGDTSGVWLALASFVQAAVVYVLSWGRGIGGTSRLDIVCFVLCMVGMVLWMATGKSVVGLVTAILADFVSIIPALVKTWRMPHTETWTFYAMGSLAAACVLAAGPYDLASMAFPLYILLADSLFIVAIAWPLRRWGTGGLRGGLKVEI